MDESQLDGSPVGGHLGIRNKTAMNICVQIFVWMCLFISPGRMVLCCMSTPYFIL